MQTGAVRIAAFALVLASVGCSEKELSRAKASALIAASWPKEGFPVQFDASPKSMIDCGLKHDLWKVYAPSGQGRNALKELGLIMYDPTERGKAFMYRMSGGRDAEHVVLLRGPFKFTVTGIAMDSRPTLRRAEFRWEIDFLNASSDIGLCLPKDKLFGNGEALFELYDDGWRTKSVTKRIAPSLQP